MNNDDHYWAKKFKYKKVFKINGVGLDISKNIEQPKKNNAIFKLTSVGELNQNKNHIIVLKALKFLNNPSFEYHVFGKGPKMSSLKKYSIQNSLNNVYFNGYVSNIPYQLSSSDIFIFPSFREGLSKALIEAMSFSLPCIASDIRGNRDLIDNEKGGFLFDPKDYLGLASLILKIYNSKDLQSQFSLYNKKKSSLYSIEKISLVYNEILKEIMV
jgi:glycosyltransferase involved in cell wall biosynthesis